MNGPTGPKHKNLGRTEVCQNEGICVVQPSLTYRLEGVNKPVVEDDDGAKHEAGVTVEFGTDGEVEFEDIRFGRGEL